MRSYTRRPMNPSPTIPTRAPTAADGDDLARLMEGLDLTRMASHMLRRAHARAEALFADIMQAGDLTPRQTAVLSATYQRPGTTVAELAEAIAVDRNTLAGMLPRLIERGLLERRRSPDDGRAWSIHLTAAGRALLARVLPNNERLQEEILRPLPPEYRPLFVKCLRLLAGVEPETEETIR